MLLGQYNKEAVTMMRFSQSAIANNVLQDCPAEFKGVISAFFKSLEALPSHQLLLISGGEQRIKAMVVEVVAQEVKNSTKKVKQIREEFAAGKYDEQVLSDSPQLTPDLEIMIAQHPREFVERLFFKCQSEQQLSFWMTHTPLPRDALALTVHLGNNIHALRYLKAKGVFEHLYQDDKKDLLMKAERFNNEGFAYLKEQLSAPPAAKLS